MQLTDFEFSFSDKAVILNLPFRETEARSFVKQRFRDLAAWALSFERQYTEIRYRSDKTFKVLASMAIESPYESVIIPGVHMNIPFMSPVLLKTLSLFLENSDERWTLIRVHDERQIAMTASCQAIIKNATVSDAINRRRPEFWDAEDLRLFHQKARQTLEIDNPNSVMQHRFKVVDRTGTDWRWMISDYRLISDNGVLYQVSNNRGWEQSQPGVLAAAFI